jgi:hypothetical protein
MSNRRAMQERLTDSRRANAVNSRGLPARRASEAGYAYIMALALTVAMIIGSQVVLENLVTQGRRQREQQTIWCGNQWARAIRLYYHKTGHYPQSIDDLETGVPDVHFLRASAIKDPMDRGDGSWRFIYVNSTGQIIGSVRYATLQQMAIMDLNNGKIPTTASALPGAVSAASLSSMSSDNGDTDNTAAPGANSGANAAGSSPGGASAGGTNGQGPQGNSPPGNASSPAPSGSTGSSAGQGSPSQSSNSDETLAFGQGQSAGIFGSPQSGAASVNANALAQLSQLKPTGPVDGPVVGAFLTGVGIPTAVDQRSIRIYHGGKKYKDWEFIWNPLEDQAQALQQGLGAVQGQGALPGQTTGAGTNGLNPFGASTGTDTSQPTSSQSSAPQPNQ